MKLWIARHGDAVGPQVDPRRPLSALGRDEVQLVARRLAESGVRVARVRHSPKARAVETARLLASELAPGVELEVDASLVPEGEPRDQLVELEGWTEDTLLVGHLPHVADLTTLLLRGRDGGAPVSFRTATVVGLEREADGRFRIVRVEVP